MVSVVENMKEIYSQAEYANPLNGTKDLVRKIYGIQFFDLYNKNDKLNVNVGDFNNIVNKKTRSLPFTLFTRSVSGLPSFEMNEVVDKYFNGMESVLPAGMQNTSGTITINGIITEELNPIKQFFKYFFKLYQTQVGLDDALLWAETDGSVTFNEEAEEGLKSKIIDNIEDDLSGNLDIYFKLVIDFKRYTNKDSMLAYILYNCWVKSIKIHTEASAENACDMQQFEMQIRYDFGKITQTVKRN